MLKKKHPDGRVVHSSILMAMEAQRLSIAMNNTFILSTVRTELNILDSPAFRGRNGNIRLLLTLMLMAIQNFVLPAVLTMWQQSITFVISITPSILTSESINLLPSLGYLRGGFGTNTGILTSMLTMISLFQDVNKNITWFGPLGTVRKDQTAL